MPRMGFFSQAGGIGALAIAVGSGLEGDGCRVGEGAAKEDGCCSEGGENASGDGEGDGEGKDKDWMGDGVGAGDSRDGINACTWIQNLLKLPK